MFKIERKAELTDTGAIVHKRFVTPWFYIRLKPVTFELESGYYRHINTVVDVFLACVTIPLPYICDQSIATHKGSRWSKGNNSINDYDFIRNAHPRNIEKLTALNDPS